MAYNAYFDWNHRGVLYTFLRVKNYLHDVLPRVEFKTIGSDGLYRLPIPPKERNSVYRQRRLARLASSAVSD